MGLPQAPPPWVEFAGAGVRAKPSAGGVPVVHWQEPFVIEVEKDKDDRVELKIEFGEGQITRIPPLLPPEPGEDPEKAIFKFPVPPLYPSHGAAKTSARSSPGERGTAGRRTESRRRSRRRRTGRRRRRRRRRGRRRRRRDEDEEEEPEEEESTDEEDEERRTRKRREDEEEDEEEKTKKKTTKTPSRSTSTRAASSARLTARRSPKRS